MQAVKKIRTALAFAATTAAVSIVAAAPAVAQSIRGHLVLSGWDSQTVAIETSFLDAATGGLAGNLDRRSVYNTYKRSADFSGYRDSASGAWIGSTPGTVMTRSGRPEDSPDTSPDASRRFLETRFSGTIGSAPGGSRTAIEVEGGQDSGTSRYGELPAPHEILTSAFAKTEWSDVATFGGHEGIGTAHVAILLEGDLGTGNTEDSTNLASMVYRFTATAFTPDWASYGNLTSTLHLQTYRVTYGGAFETDSWRYDDCEGSTTGARGVCAGHFSTVLEGDLTFQYGAPILFGAQLMTRVDGEGWADVSDTARFVMLSAPEGTTITYASDLTGDPLTITAVPEPATYATVGAGLGLIALLRGRRRPAA